MTRKDLKPGDWYRVSQGEIYFVVMKNDDCFLIYSPNEIMKCVRTILWDKKHLHRILSGNEEIWLCDKRRS